MAGDFHGKLVRLLLLLQLVAFSCFMKISRQSKRIINCAAATGTTKTTLQPPPQKTTTTTTTTTVHKFQKVGIMHRCAEAEL